MSQEIDSILIRGVGILVAVFGFFNLCFWIANYGSESSFGLILDPFQATNFHSLTVNFYVYLSVILIGLALIFRMPWVQYCFFLGIGFYLIFLFVSLVMAGMTRESTWYVVHLVTLGLLLGVLYQKSSKSLLSSFKNSKRSSIAFLASFLVVLSTWVAISVKKHSDIIEIELEEVKANLKEDNIISLVLERHYKDGGFTVVSPKTGIDLYDSEMMDVIDKSLKLSERDVSFLLDDLIKKNKKSIPLKIKSDLSKGYLIDFDGKFRNYFKSDGGGWEKWYKENPKAYGITTVSRPAYDIRSRMVLIYIGNQSHWLAGGGYVILYEYKNKELIKVDETMVWIS